MASFGSFNRTNADVVIRGVQIANVQLVSPQPCTYPERGEFELITRNNKIAFIPSCGITQAKQLIVVYNWSNLLLFVCLCTAGKLYVLFGIRAQKVKDPCEKINSRAEL